MYADALERALRTIAIRTGGIDMETDFTAKEDDLSSMSQTELAELTTDQDRKSVV